MNQRPLPLFSDWNDALMAVVHALGGFKKVGCELRPELKTRPEAAAQWLRDCLNEDKRDKLDPAQVHMLLRMAREVGFHAAKHWQDSELGYEQSLPIAPRDELAELLRRQSDVLAEFKHTADRIERLTKSPLSNVMSLDGRARD
ncbi:MAG TPA: hypothetical protein VN667_12975 [Burkholderiales bacterium]|nr:hypothetical protein [Burkholderiales bacterium]